MKSSIDNLVTTRGEELDKPRVSTEQKKMGRPPIPPQKARSNRVVTLLTDKEYDRLKEWAESKGTTLSQACRIILGRYLENRNDPKKTGEK